MSNVHILDQNPTKIVSKFARQILLPCVVPKFTKIYQNLSTKSDIENFKNLLPENTRIYIAHIEGTPIDDMVKTARGLAEDGFPTMPHFPARIIKDKATLNEWISRYQGEAGVNQALLLAGGVSKPHGDYDSSMSLLETGLFDKANFKNIHIAGHPEGNKDIDPDGTTVNVDAALKCCLLYTSPSPRDRQKSRMPSSA